jgi:two-component system, response regulator / RNA-binding antiterminator
MVRVQDGVAVAAADVQGHQMTRRPIQNFRGLCAAALCPDDRNRAVLTETLAKLGLKLQTADPLEGIAPLTTALQGADFVFFDADLVEAVGFCWHDESPSRPVIAIVGLEAPGRLQRAFDFGLASTLHKPLRSTGIYSALFFAANEHRRRQELILKMQALEARHRGRRFVTRAIVLLMQQQDVDDDQAYRLLRQESMRLRMTIEELAVHLVAGQPLHSLKATRHA